MNVKVLAALVTVLAGIAGVVAALFGDNLVGRIFGADEAIPSAATSPRIVDVDESAAPLRSELEDEAVRPGVSDSEGEDATGQELGMPASDAGLTSGPAPLDPPARTYPAQVGQARHGLTVTLESLVETERRYVATIRVDNANAYDVGIAMKYAGPSEADVTLVDTAGGSCQVIANGEGWGTLRAYREGVFGGNADDWFATVGAESSGHFTIFFNKGRCDIELRQRENLSIRGVLVAWMSDTARDIPVSFRGLPLF